MNRNNCSRATGISVHVRRNTQVEGTWESWFIVDKNRNYFSLSALDGLIKGIFIDDRRLITEEGIRVGDSLSRVMVAYPDVKFKHDGKLLETDFFEMSANEGKVEFWFVAKKDRGLIKDGFKMHLNDDVVRESKVSAIIIFR